jgi:glycerophosphoryl diester phosphodiesterase
MEHKKNWITSAHRGFVEGGLKENCLAAYYNAFLHGAEKIETDARLSSDGVLIVNHDDIVRGFNDKGEAVSYVVAETPAEVICSVILSNDEKWGVQRVPTLEAVLHLVYNTGMHVNIDLKNGIEIAKSVAMLVLKCGLQGKVIYALNRSGMEGINAILEIDPDARFIDCGANFARAVKDFAQRGKRCFCYTSDTSTENISAIRDRGCLLALISLDKNTFKRSIECHPDMCEFLHTSDFKAIEEDYFNNLKLY